MKLSDDNRNGIISVGELGRTEYHDLKWLIPGILPMEGVMMLAAPPKAGKSLLVLNIVLAAALGLPPLGFTNANPVKVNTLYLDLETSHRRIRSRIQRIIAPRPFPPNIDIAIAWPRMGSGGMKRLHTYLDDHDVQMVIIDTFGAFQAERGSHMQFSYQRDRGDIQRIKDLSSDYDILTVLIHHTRKEQSQDWVQMFSGTHGLSGTCDTLFLLNRSRSETSAMLYATGRDIDEGSYGMVFDINSYQWRYINDKRFVGLSKERREILELLNSMEESLAPKEVAAMLNRTEGSVRRLMVNMEADKLILRESRGQYVDRLQF